MVFLRMILPKNFTEDLFERFPYILEDRYPWVGDYENISGFHILLHGEKTPLDDIGDMTQTYGLDLGSPK